VLNSRLESKPKVVGSIETIQTSPSFSCLCRDLNIIKASILIGNEQSYFNCNCERMSFSGSHICLERQYPLISLCGLANLTLSGSTILQQTASQSLYCTALLLLLLSRVNNLDSSSRLSQGYPTAFMLYLSFK
jgi:hypothetical protein